MSFSMQNYRHLLQFKHIYIHKDIYISASAIERTSATGF